MNEPRRAGSGVAGESSFSTRPHASPARRRAGHGAAKDPHHQEVAPVLHAARSRHGPVLAVRTAAASRRRAPAPLRRQEDQTAGRAASAPAAPDWATLCRPAAAAPSAVVPTTGRHTGTQQVGLETAESCCAPRRHTRSAVIATPAAVRIAHHVARLVGHRFQRRARAPARCLASTRPGCRAPPDPVRRAQAGKRRHQVNAPVSVRPRLRLRRASIKPNESRSHCGRPVTKTDLQA